MASQVEFHGFAAGAGVSRCRCVVVAIPSKVKRLAGEPGEIEFLEIRSMTVSAPTRHRARARRCEAGVASATPESRAVKGSRMAAKHSRHIALTEPLIAYVEAQVAKGEYTCISEVVRTALRLLIERDEARAFRGAANPEAARDRA
ncbi:ribbon-helix-helix domain-containing protein [Methylobacterium platani]|nr:type II toxin-antitoxin system ParD family antitoxin [Methylobacterium platani]